MKIEMSSIIDIVQLFKEVVNGVKHKLYLKDGEGIFHRVSEIEIYSAKKIRCEDGYWDYIQFCVDDIKGGDECRLYVEE